MYITCTDRNVHDYLEQQNRTPVPLRLERPHEAVDVLFEQTRVL